MANMWKHEERAQTGAYKSAKRRKEQIKGNIIAQIHGCKNRLAHKKKKLKFVTISA